MVKRKQMMFALAGITLLPGCSGMQVRPHVNAGQAGGQTINGDIHIHHYHSAKVDNAEILRLFQKLAKTSPSSARRDRRPKLQ